MFFALSADRSTSQFAGKVPFSYSGSHTYATVKDAPGVQIRNARRRGPANIAMCARVHERIRVYDVLGRQRAIETCGERKEGGGGGQRQPRVCVKVH